jgi:hypothetical protein
MATTANDWAAAAAAAAFKGIDIKSIRYGVVDTAEGSTANSSSFSTDDSAKATALHIPGTLAVDGQEFSFTAISHIPAEPLLNQARTLPFTTPVVKC